MDRQGKISEDQAPFVFIAYWERERTRDIGARYGVDPRRVYDVLRDRTHPGSRNVALRILRESNPNLADLAETGALDPGPETTISRKPNHNRFINQIEMEI